MNDRFTARAINALQYAQEEARRLSQNYVGTEHLLLGIMRDGDGIAARALDDFGLDIDDVRDVVANYTGAEETSTPDNPYYTPRAKHVLELAYEAAGSLGHNYIGTEHLLLGIVAEQRGIAARVLGAFGLSAKAVRKAVMDLLGGTHEDLEGGGSSESSSHGAKGDMPYLRQYGRDLNEMARGDKMDPVIGREKEIERVMQILSRRTKNNPILIGEPGVGKTAIAEGLAQRITSGAVPHTLRDKIVISVSMASILAGAKYRGEFEERLKGLLDEVRKNGNIILFIDEMHTLVGAGGAEGSIDAANIMKPALSRGEIQVIGATTLNEYKKYFEKDSALARRFQPILVGEPSADDAIKILFGLRDKYEAFHRAKITDEAIEAAVKFSRRYITDRYLPDKAIDLMDEASSKVRMKAFSVPESIKKIEDQISSLEREKEAAINAQEYERCAPIRDEQARLKHDLDEEKSKWEKREENRITVKADDIAEVVAQWTGIPVQRIAAKESDRLLKLEKILSKRVVGQDEAVSAVARAIRRARSGLKDPRRPIGSFLFLGPTGVGKTELARALSEALFGSEDEMIRVDMSEYMEKYSVSRLVGAPPGYVGYDEGGQLTDAVRKKPYSVILLDEIEKANPDVFNILLQVLEDGRLTDGQGRTVDFKNTVIIMTSNAGADLLKPHAPALGFAAMEETAEENHKAASKRVLEEVRHVFKPEFLNRIDDMLVFRPLGREELSKIVDILLRDVKARVSERGMTLTVNPAAKVLLAEKGADFKYGARPLKRAIQKLVEDPLSEQLLSKAFRKGDMILARKSGNELVFVKKEEKKNIETAQ